MTDAREPRVSTSGSGRTRDTVWRESKAESSSQVPPGLAMRARDVARPTEDDLAEAEANAVVVRRNWKPST